jgi:hypothetical protein
MSPASLAIGQLTMKALLSMGVQRKHLVSRIKILSATICVVNVLLIDDRVFAASMKVSRMLPM